MNDLFQEGLSNLDAGHLSEAIASLHRILANDPGNLPALNALANAFHATGDHALANPIRLKLIEASTPPLQWRFMSNYLMSLQYQPDVDDEDLLVAARHTGHAFGAQRSMSGMRKHAIGPLRMGFISADFCDHPVGLFCLPLIEHLDRTQIQPVLFFAQSRNDWTAGALKSLAEWHDVSSMESDALEALLHRHQLDVMVDLSGHTAGNCLPVLARRVAPLQISWLGYFATTGVAAMDCVLMDPWHVPDGYESAFTERVLRMPHNRFCFRPPVFAPDVFPLPCKSRGYITFGSFNNTTKYNPEVFSCWAAILSRVPCSRLVLKWRSFHDDALRGRVLANFGAMGIAADRLDLRVDSVHRVLLEEYADIDIALDPFPFSGGHTSCEALWMGVPVVTLPGTRAVSRQTLSFIAALGSRDWLQRWTASTSNDYVDKAVALAEDILQLDRIRVTLRSAMKASPLLDAARFARDFERVIAGAVQGR